MKQDGLLRKNKVVIQATLYHQYNVTGGLIQSLFLMIDAPAIAWSVIIFILSVVVVGYFFPSWCFQTWELISCLV